MLKVILDTSVFISALLSKNTETAPNQILARWQQGDFTLVVSPQLQEELVIVLLRKRISPDLIEDLFTRLLIWIILIQMIIYFWQPLMSQKQII